MHTENNFSYTYSAAENQEALHIRQAYLPQAETNLDELKALDAKVKRPANVFAYVFGSVSAIIMGTGMSLVMTDLGTTLGLADPMVPGIVIGILGLVMALLTQPIHKSMLNSRKKKYAERILQLSEKIIRQ